MLAFEREPVYLYDLLDQWFSNMAFCSFSIKMGIFFLIKKFKTKDF